MRNKFILTEEESKRILSLHSKKIQEERNTTSNSLLNEASYTLDTKKYTLTTNDYTDANRMENGNNNPIKVIGGITYTPTQRGNLSAQGEIEYTNSGSRKKTTINFICANNKINADGQYYDVMRNDSTLAGFQKLCETTKKMKKDSYGIQQTGGAVKGYSQQNVYTLTSKDGKKTITIPKGTGYTAKKDSKGNEGATFRIGPTIFGWFGCKSKTFFIDKVLYIDEKGTLSNNISNAVCVVKTNQPQKDTKPLNSKEGQQKNVISGGGGVGSRYTFDFNTIMKEIDSKCVSKKTPEPTPTPEINTTLSNDIYQTLTSL
jgi:hypothetical protein